MKLHPDYVTLSVAMLLFPRATAVQFSSDQDTLWLLNERVWTADRDKQIMHNHMCKQRFKECNTHINTLDFTVDVHMFSQTNTHTHTKLHFSHALSCPSTSSPSLLYAAHTV